ncbi:MAG: YicC/YloC family endoribonuclease [Bacteroidota bacterium]
MLQSMTGYGRAEQEFENRAIIVELKSLNSKFLDLKVRIPQGYREKDMEIRKIASTSIMRGKVDLILDIKYLDASDEMVFNRDLFKRYYKELLDTTKELNPGNIGDITQSVMRLPNILMPSDDVVNEGEWEVVKDVLGKAINKLNEFRKTEGQSMEDDFRIRVNSILDLLHRVEPFESPRIDKLRKRFRQNLEDLTQKGNIDENRFEQEVIYYIEKMDITEEKVRLEQHCQYFLEQLDANNGEPKGRKLNFISQEMGREINTLGAKANSADIQRLVVLMKDELEKIKEQTANVL